MRIAFPLFNRASYGRCKVLLDTLAKRHEVTLFLGSAINQKEYDDASTYIRKNHSNIKIVDLHVPYRVPSDSSSALIVSDIIVSLSPFASRGLYDCAFVFADRFETIGAAIAFAFAGVPLLHVQGGEITGNIDERIRHAVTQLSDYHFTSTKLAKEYVCAMGQNRPTVHHTGCPSLDLISKARVRRKQHKSNYIICMFHPHTEEIQEAHEQSDMILKQLRNYCAGKKLTCHLYMPNPDPGREAVSRRFKRAIEENPEIFVETKNKEPEQFLKELAGARLIIGNSSCLLREASYLGVPAINVGDRQRLRERSFNVVDCDFVLEEINQALQFQSVAKKHTRSFLYGEGDASRQILAYMEASPLKLKDSLNYPHMDKFKHRHLSSRRFDDHKRKLTRRWVHTDKPSNSRVNI